MKAADADDFWQFSLGFYGWPGVESACLQLQDEAGLNVNLVLWCCWQALQGRQLGRDDVRAAASRIAEWSRTVTEPLRDLRRRVKAETDEMSPLPALPAIYQRLKLAELEAERVEQALLGRMIPEGNTAPPSDLACLAKSNLAAYMEAAIQPGGGRVEERIPAKLAQSLCEWSARSGFEGF